MLRAVRGASRESHRFPIAENYHDIVFSQERRKIASAFFFVECLLAGGGNGFNDSFGMKPFVHWNLLEPFYLREKHAVGQSERNG